MYRLERVALQEAVAPVIYACDRKYTEHSNTAPLIVDDAFRHADEDAETQARHGLSLKDVLQRRRCRVRCSSLGSRTVSSTGVNVLHRRSRE